jgi:hypothetical protein
MPRWTPESRDKQSALIRTWKPWEKSTGARTPEGKAIVAANSPGKHWRELVRLSAWHYRTKRRIDEGEMLSIEELEAEFKRRGRKLDL